MRTAIRKFCPALSLLLCAVIATLLATGNFSGVFVRAMKDGDMLVSWDEGVEPTERSQLHDGVDIIKLSDVMIYYENEHIVFEGMLTHGDSKVPIKAAGELFKHRRDARAKYPGILASIRDRENALVEDVVFHALRYPGRDTAEESITFSVRPCSDSLSVRYTVPLKAGTIRKLANATENQLSRNLIREYTYLSNAALELIRLLDGEELQYKAYKNHN